MKKQTYVEIEKFSSYGGKNKYQVNAYATGVLVNTQIFDTLEDATRRKQEIEGKTSPFGTRGGRGWHGESRRHSEVKR